MVIVPFTHHAVAMLSSVKVERAEAIPGDAVSIEPTVPSLIRIYQRYLASESTATFIREISDCYTMGTLERLVANGDRVSRRAAVLALTFLGDYDCNATLGRALHDEDRGVRVLAENGIRQLWYRAGNQPQEQMLRIILRLNCNRQFGEAIQLADQLLEEAPWFAEAWNQRAISYFHQEHFRQSVRDCQQALDLNAYHFGAAVGMAHCYLELSDAFSALESFRWALKLNPDMDGVRVQVEYLQRTLEES